MGTLSLKDSYLFLVSRSNEVSWAKLIFNNFIPPLELFSSSMLFIPSSQQMKT